MHAQGEQTANLNRITLFVVIFVVWVDGAPYGKQVFHTRAHRVEDLHARRFPFVNCLLQFVGHSPRAAVSWGDSCGLVLTRNVTCRRRRSAHRSLTPRARLRRAGASPDGGAIHRLSHRHSACAKSVCFPRAAPNPFLSDPPNLRTRRTRGFRSQASGAYISTPDAVLDAGAGHRLAGCLARFMGPFKTNF